MPTQQPAIEEHSSRFAWIDLDGFPDIVRVADLLDIYLTHRKLIPNTITPGFSLGWVPNDKAAIEIQATPAFTSLAELNTFCNKHMTQFEIIAGNLQDIGYPGVGGWFWERSPEFAFNQVERPVDANEALKQSWLILREQLASAQVDGMPLTGEQVIKQMDAILTVRSLITRK